MASDYTGNPAVFYGVIALLDDGDKRTAISVRVSQERIIDSLANLNADTVRLSSGGTLEGVLVVDGPSGRITINSGAAIGVLAGGVINLGAGSPGGEINAGAGAALVGSLDLPGALVLKSGGTISAEAGSTIVVADTTSITIASQATAARMLMVSQFIENGAWTQESARKGTWVQSDVSAAYANRIPLNVRPGDVIVSLLANLNGAGGSGGGHSVRPGTMPQLTIFSVDTGGVATTEAQTSDTAASQAAYDVDHTVILTNGTETAGTMPITIASTKAYYVDVRGEAGSNSVASALQLNSISLVVTANTYRPGTEYI